MKEVSFARAAYVFVVLALFLVGIGVVIGLAGALTDDEPQPVKRQVWLPSGFPTETGASNYPGLDLSCHYVVSSKRLQNNAQKPIAGDRFQRRCVFLKSTKEKS